VQIALFCKQDTGVGLSPAALQEMSRSRKKPILRDKKWKEWFRIVRRKWKQEIRQGKEPTSPKVLVNDYDWCDWIWFSKTEKSKRK